MSFTSERNISQLQSFRYFSLRKTGSVRNYYASNTLIAKGKFVAISETDLDCIKMDGKCFWYYENGNLLRIANFRNVVAFGFVKHFDSRGLLEKEIPINNDVEDSLFSVEIHTQIRLLLE